MRNTDGVRRTAREGQLPRRTAPLCRDPRILVAHYRSLFSRSHLERVALNPSGSFSRLARARARTSVSSRNLDAASTGRSIGIGRKDQANLSSERPSDLAQRTSRCPSFPCRTDANLRNGRVRVTGSLPELRDRSQYRNRGCFYPAPFARSLARCYFAVVLRSPLPEVTPRRRTRLN